MKRIIQFALLCIVIISIFIFFYIYFSGGKKITVDSDKPADQLIKRNENNVIKNLKLIQAQAIDSEIMPPNNLTGITNQEREKLRIWIEQGANTNN